jgi:hypothetical protein
VTTTPRGAEATMRSLFRHAYVNGMAAVKGGAQPVLMAELFRHQCFFRYRGATVYHSRDPDIVDSILRSRAVLGGLAGERWTKLDQDAFG